MGAETVTLHRSPSHLEPGRPFVARPDPVFPVVVGREVPARPAKDGDVQLLDGLQYVLAVAVRIGKRRVLVKYAPLDTTPKMLDEIAVDLSLIHISEPTRLLSIS